MVKPVCSPADRSMQSSEASFEQLEGKGDLKAGFLHKFEKQFLSK